MLPCDNVGVAGYKVYRDGQIVGTPAAPSFEDAGLVADTAYSYAVSGYDAANNESFLSPSLDVITDPAPPPTNVAPVVTISAPADGSSFTEGDSVIFMAAASDTEDGDIDGGKEKIRTGGELTRTLPYTIRTTARYQAPS